MSHAFRRRHGEEVFSFGLQTDGVLIDHGTDSRWSDEGLCLDGALKAVRLEEPFCAPISWFVWSTAQSTAQPAAILPSRGGPAPSRPPELERLTDPGDCLGAPFPLLLSLLDL